jgi:cytochrome c peroxidase
MSSLIATQGRLASGPTGPERASPGDQPIQPVPPVAELDPGKVHLGERLFHDVRLSRGDVIACASCHLLAEGGADNRARSPPPRGGEALAFNTPTVFNAVLNFRLNWLGNFRTLETHNKVLLHHPRVMDITWDELLGKLRADPDYRRAFAVAYGQEPDAASVLDALATFERALLTPNARFDRYLGGQRDAITEAEARGYGLFKAYGCTACHQGVAVGGNLFQKFGIFEDPFPPDRVPTEADLGRFAITGDDRDRFVFRVPSLRNVAVTAPYFHDGSAPTLEQAIAVMGRKQLGWVLTEEEIGLIAAFLRTLTGEYRGRALDAARSGNYPP